MKKITALLITLTLLLGSLFACAESTVNDGKINIIATNFPLYDFSRAVSNDVANVRMLLPIGGETHSYEPSAKDIADILNCDLFICIGGESDAWIDDILLSLDRPVRVLRVIDSFSDLQVHDHKGEEKYDEHIWTSPKNAIKICELISDELSVIDEENADSYMKNCDEYTARINALDIEFESFFDTLENKTLVFGDRFPFLHFANEYGLDYISAFPGCAKESEPSMATVAEIINKVKNEKIGTVFYMEFSNHNIADTIARETGANTALLHSCHNISRDEFDSGVSYVSLMNQNLHTLKGTMN